MAIYLEKAIFINRAPFEHLELDFKEKGVNVLSAVNGRGKTTILSHIVDAFYELARPNFENEFADKSNKYYRVSSPVFNINMKMSSFVYLRFKKDAEIWDYVDIRNKCTEDEYNSNISLDNKIPFSELSGILNDSNNIKKWCKLTERDKVIKLFGTSLLTYFPSYRYEEPGFLNEPYSFKIEHKIESGFSGYLPNRIEVFCQFKEIANWMSDVILDHLQQAQNLNKFASKIQPYLKESSVQNLSLADVLKNFTPSDIGIISNLINLLQYPQQAILTNINKVITYSLASKFPNSALMIGVGERNLGSTRLNISLEDNPTKVLYPSIFNMSSGEKALISVFVEILHQIDNLHVHLSNITGIVLIDEIDKNLHIKMQYEVLPKLFAMFPNVQFITSSHSPFLNMGLADEMKNDSQIIDLDNNGIVCSPVNTDLYREVYALMISENNRFAEKYNDLRTKVDNINKPVVITEGKTDWKHFKAALKHFKENHEYEDLDIELLEYDFDFGDKRLNTLLNQYNTFPHRYKIIGIFDCDEDNGRDIYIKNNGIKHFGGNIWGMSIPVPVFRQYNTSGISIEFLYKDEDLKRQDENGRRIFVTSEFDENGRLKLEHKIGVKNNHDVKNYILPEKEKIQADEVIDIDGNSLALSKEQFASNILAQKGNFANVDFDAFRPVFDRLRSIIQDTVHI